jgi:hypothetical protein
MPIYLLLAMQAAGMITDFFGTRSQDQLMKMGMKVQQAGIEADVAMTRLESQDASLQAMKQLRQTMGTQIATMAARGTAAGAGSAFMLLNESQANFNADERIRKLNLLGKENQLRANAAISRLQYSGDSSKLWQGFAQRTINRFPTSVSGWQGMGQGASQGFGMTSAAGA